MPPRHSRSRKQVDTSDPSYTVQLYAIFHTPITSLSQPTPAFNVREFRYSSTGLESYDSASSVQTSIVHPVLKIALKIICNIIYAQIETTKAGKAELFLLWCMITGSYHPHFGDLIIRRFHRVIALCTSGAIRCGGLISVITHSLVPQSPPKYTFFTGDYFCLTLQNFRAMHMLRNAPSGFVWMRGRSTYFKVTRPDAIALPGPISETVWVLPSNIPPPPCLRRAQQAQRPQSDRPSSSTQHLDYTDATPISFSPLDPMQTDFHDQPPPTQPSHLHPDSPFTYQHYLDLRQDIASLQQTMTGLRLDYQQYSTQVTDYRDELLGLRDHFTDFRDDFFRCYAPPSE
ncbi:unnamed protein product [Lactuca saligna]|uniref:Uncharacterized protein n=1 Tax=Lactuca saligna TaxID=75948 RepID=A0AA36A3Y1_LACSI|nr:unnamed protein product [Lactuca saligna]